MNNLFCISAEKITKYDCLPEQFEYISNIDEKKQALPIIYIAVNKKNINLNQDFFTSTRFNKPYQSYQIIWWGENSCYFLQRNRTIFVLSFHVFELSNDPCRTYRMYSCVNENFEDKLKLPYKKKKFI